MERFFSLDNPVWNFLGKTWDVLWVSILWFVCSIPIVTLGASTSALYYVGLKLTKNEEGYVTKQFFHAFKQNLKPGTILGVMAMAFGVLWAFNIRFYAGKEDSLYKVMFILMLVVGWMYIITIHYLFAALAQFHNTIKGYIKFSFMLAVQKLGWTFLMIIINVLIILATSLFLPLILVLPGLIVVTNCSIINRCFKPYIVQDEDQTAEEIR